MRQDATKAGLPIAAIGLRPMHQRPQPGECITVMMRDGQQVPGCIATLVHMQGWSGIVIYSGRRPLREHAALGWWPNVRKAFEPTPRSRN
ncbi:MAG TPA: hypothetical protein VFP68_05180 [Burkholderiaceae bacterium]|nr:hypothetical protein [Burkholderiaceae bacterium]